MKKRILYTVLLAAGLAFSSCSDQFLQDMTVIHRKRLSASNLIWTYIFRMCIITIFISRV
jgi:hypothetical protein